MIQKYKERLMEVEAMRNTGKNFKELEEFFQKASEGETPSYDKEGNMLLDEFNFLGVGDWLILDDSGFTVMDDVSFNLHWEKA